MKRKADLARQRSVYCSAVEWAAIVERAAAADMNASRFLMACALGEDGPPDGQEELLRKVELFDRFVEALLARLPGTEMSIVPPGLKAGLSWRSGSGQKAPASSAVSTLRWIRESAILMKLRV